MGINKNNIFLLVFFILQTVCGCNSCKSLDGPTNYSLSGGIANMAPDKDSVKIGDTLYFSSTIPTKLQPDQNGQPTGGLIDFSGASNVSTDIHIISLVGANMLVNAVDSFSFISPQIGSIQTNPLLPGAAKTVTFKEQSGTYNLKFGAIALKRGIYCFTIVDIFAAKKNQTSASISILMQDNDVHLHYLRDIFYSGNPVGELDSTRSYCFKVY